MATSGFQKSGFTEWTPCSPCPQTALRKSSSKQGCTLIFCDAWGEQAGSMLKSHTTTPHGTRWCPLPVRKRGLHRLRIQYSNGDVDAAPAEQPPEATEFVPTYAPPQYPAQYYQTAPQVAPPPPPPPPSSETPFWIWVLVGAALHWVYTKVQEFRKNPMAALAGMMGGAKPGVGGAGGGDMAQMMEMMQRMQQQQQQQQSRAPNPFNGMAPNTTTINTTASDVVPPTSQPQARTGAKFEENKKGASNGGASSTVSSQPDVKPQSTPPSSFFSDTQTAQPASQASFFQDTSSNAGQQSAPSAADAAASEAMIDNMLLMVADNKQLRDQLGMHLPESMNNDATWKWIKENPEMRKQMAKQISPGLAAQFGDMSMFNQYTNTQSNEDLMNQMKSMGVDPGEMMSKVMADPEVMQIMTKPHVAQALMEMQTNPASAVKYMSDPDVFKLMQKIVEMNPALKNGNMPPPPMS